MNEVNLIIIRFYLFIYLLLIFYLFLFLFLFLFILYYRIKLLSGNSKALIEEEKFRKTGKRKYEQITERMIALAAILEQLGSVGESTSNSPVGQGQGGSGSGSVLTPSATVAVDFSCLSSQGQALLRGKGHWQERVELMHLHTTTHGTRRWSGGGDKEEHEPSPKGTGDNVFSLPQPPIVTHTTHTKSRLVTPLAISTSFSTSLSSSHGTFERANSERGNSERGSERERERGNTSSSATVSANPFAAAAAVSTVTTTIAPSAHTPMNTASHTSFANTTTMSGKSTTNTVTATTSGSGVLGSMSVTHPNLGPAVRTKTEVPVLTQLNLGLAALALKGGASKGTGTGTASISNSNSGFNSGIGSSSGSSSLSLSPRNKASAQAMKDSLAVMTSSLASLSNSQNSNSNAQRILPGTNSASNSQKGDKSVSFQNQKVGDENLRNSK